MTNTALSPEKSFRPIFRKGVEGKRTSDRLFVTLLFVYAALLLVWLISQPLPPLQDFADWVYQGWVGAGLLSHQPAITARFTTVHFPVPNSVSQVALTILTTAVGALTSAKIFVTLLLVGFAAACYLSAHRWKMENPGASAFVLFCLFGVNAMFWDGYANYQVSILVFFWFLLLRNRRSARWILITGLVLFFCHAATFFAFVLLVFFESITERNVVRTLAALSPSLCLLLWYVLARDHGSAHHLSELYGGLTHHLEYTAYTFSKLGPFHNLGDFTRHSLAGRAHGLYLAGVALNVAFALVLLYAVVALLVRQPRRDPLLLTSAILFATFVALPGVLFTVVNLGERMLYPCLLLFFFRNRSLKIPKLLAVVIVGGIALTSAQFLTMPAAKASDSAVRVPGPGPEIKPYYVRFGLYNSDLYRFDTYRVFLEHPDIVHMPQLGFQSSIFRDREEDSSPSGD